MDVLTSTEFRKRYAALRSPTHVTVNGHVIGTWTPSLVPQGFDAEVEKVLGLSPSLRVAIDRTPVLRDFAEFHPAPKPGRK